MRNYKKYLIQIFGTTLGVLGGYLYYKFVGCQNGCAITSNPYLSMLWGAAIGYLLSDTVAQSVRKRKTTSVKPD